MDECSISSPQSSTPADPEMFPKRQKVDSSNPSISSTSGSDFVLGTDWERRRMEREVEALRLKLSQTEATAIQHHKLRRETEELLVQEKIILEMQAQRDKETIEQLEKDLDTAMRRAHESRKSQVAAESTLSKIKSTMGEQIRELSTKNAELRHNLTQLTSEKYRESQEELEAAHQKIKELEKNSVSQAEFDLESMKLKQAKMTIEKLTSTNRNWTEREKLMKSRIKELEEEVESEKDKIATLDGILQEKVVANERFEQQLIGMEEKSEYIKKLEAEVLILRGRLQEFSSKLHKSEKEEGVTPETSKQGIPRSQHVEVAVQTEIESEAEGDDQQTQQNKKDDGQRRARKAKRKSVEMTRQNIEEFDDVQSVVDGSTADDGDPSWNAERDDVSSDSQPDDDSVGQTDEDEDVEESPIGGKRVDKDLLVQVGKNYHVLASSSAFFRIVWQYDYRRIAAHKYACKKCDVVQSLRMNIEDHIWVSHYDGSFTCPLCIGRPRVLRWRNNIARHVEKAHAQLHLGAKEKFSRNRKS